MQVNQQSDDEFETLPTREAMTLVPGDIEKPVSDKALLEEINSKAAESLAHTDKAAPSQVARRAEKTSQKFIA
jgi:hypothetical protein